MQRWTHTCICICSGLGGVFYCNNFKNLAPITCDARCLSSLHSCYFAALCLSFNVFLLNICCDFYLYLTITDSRDFYAKNLQFEFHHTMKGEKKRVKILTFLFSFWSRKANVGYVGRSGSAGMYNTSSEFHVTFPEGSEGGREWFLILS